MVYFQFQVFVLFCLIFVNQRQLVCFVEFLCVFVYFLWVILSLVVSASAVNFLDDLICVTRVFC